MKTAFQLIEEHGLTLHGDIEHFAELVRAEALAEPDFWEGYVPEPDSTCNNTLRAQGKAYTRTCKKCGKGPCVGLAQQALDKKAENARELGLDYEPAQQEPFGYFRYDLRLDAWVQNRAGIQGTPFYTSPPAQRTWVDLTDEEIQTEWVLTPQNDKAEGIWFGRRIEAKLKEKNT